MCMFLIFMHSQQPINFKGFMYGKLVYKIKDAEKTRIVGPVWICNLGNNALVKKINTLSNTSKNEIKVKLDTHKDNPALAFEITKEAYNRTNSFFVKIANRINADPAQAKVLNHPDLQSIIFKLTKSDFESLALEGKRYEYKPGGGKGFYKSLKNLFTKPFHDKNIQNFRKNIQSYFTEHSQLQWLDNFFSRIKK